MANGPKTNIAIIIIALLLVLAACVSAQAVIEPVIFALFIIAISLPLQYALQQKIGKAFAVAITMLVVAATILALLSLIFWEGREIAEWIRGNAGRIQALMSSSTLWLENHDIFILASLSDVVNPAMILRVLQIVMTRLNTILAFALIVMIYVVLGLNEAHVLAGRIAVWKNQDASGRVLNACRRIGEKFRTFMVVRTFASVATGLAVWGLAYFLGIELAAACGFLAFSLNYLPYIGSLIVSILVPLFAIVQFGSIETALLALIGILLIQAIIGSYLEPLFSGEALTISPPLILFSVVLWTFLWGALGAFLGVPMAIAVITLCEEFPSTRGLADFLSGGRNVAN